MIIAELQVSSVAMIATAVLLVALSLIWHTRIPAFLDWFRAPRSESVEPTPEWWRGLRHGELTPELQQRERFEHVVEQARMVDRAVREIQQERSR